MSLDSSFFNMGVILPFIRVIVISFFVLFLPGYLLKRVLFRGEKDSLLEGVPIAFCFSLGIITIPNIIVQIFRFPLVIIPWFLFIVTALLGFINLLIFRNKEGIDKVKKTTSSVSGKRLLAVFLFLIITFTAVACFLGGFQSWDPLVSLGYIQRNLQSDYVFTTDVDFKEYPPMEDAYNVWDMTLFLLAYLTGIGPIQLWMYLPVILVPITTLAFFVMAKQLFKDDEASILSAILFILYQGVYNRFWIWQIGGYYGVLPNFTLLPVGLVFFFRYLSSGKIKYAWLTAILGFIMVKSSIYCLSLLLLSLLNFAIFTLILLQRDQKIKIIKQTCFTILFILVISSTYLWYSVYQLLFCAKSSFLWRSDVDIVHLTKNLYYIHPIALFSPHHYVFYDHRYFSIYIIIAFCLTPFLLLYTRKNKETVFLFANMVVPPLVMLNPFLVPSLVRILPEEFTRRLGQLLPFILVLGFFFTRGLSSVEQFFLKVRWRLPQIKLIFIGIAVVILVMSPPFNRGLVQLWHISIAELRYHDKEAPNYIPALEFLRENAPQGSVILSDYYLSRHVPAYTGHYIVYPATDNFSTFVSDQEANRRRQCFENLLNPSISIEETVKWLKRYGVTHIVLNEKCIYLLKGNRLEAYSIPHESLLKINSYPTIFQSLFGKNGIRIFGVTYNTGISVTSNSVLTRE